MEGTARDRFRLIYLKSADPEKSTRDEPAPCAFGKTDRPDRRSFPLSGTRSSKMRLDQAREDLKHPDPRIRVLAIRSLEQADEPDAVPLLREALSDSNPDVRAKAIQILIRCRDPELTVSLKKFLKDRHDQVKIAALRGLFQLQEKLDLNLLLQLLSDESPWVRRKLATLLGWTRGEGVLPILVELSKDIDPKVRKAALISLITLYPEESEGHLLKGMMDPEPALRSWTKRTLEKRIQQLSAQRSLAAKRV